MFSKILAFIGSFFTGSKIGIILTIIFSKASSTIIQEILNKENQNKAYEFVKELNERNDITNSEKATIFNKQMGEWAVKMGKKIHESVINCLRELAVNALKAENKAE